MALKMTSDAQTLNKNPDLYLFILWGMYVGDITYPESFSLIRIVPVLILELMC